VPFLSALGVVYDDPLYKSTFTLLEHVLYLSALEMGIALIIRRYTNVLFTYLLTYLLVTLNFLPMTLIFEPDLHGVKFNQGVKYLCQYSSSHRLFSGYTDTHT